MRTLHKKTENLTVQSIDEWNADDADSYTHRAQVISADFSWIIRVYHNHPCHLRSVFC